MISSGYSLPSTRSDRMDSMCSSSALMGVLTGNRPQALR